MTKVEFSITDEAEEKFLRKFQEVLQEREDAKEGGQKVTLSDTAKYVFQRGGPRLMATTKYALRKAGKLAPYKKPEKKAKAPKAKPAKKITKPKGPLARKAASKPKAPKVRKAKPALTGSTEGSTSGTPAPVLD